MVAIYDVIMVDPGTNKTFWKKRKLHVFGTKDAHERRPVAIRELNMILSDRAEFQLKIGVNCAFYMRDIARHVYIALFTFSASCVPAPIIASILRIDRMKASILCIGSL